MPIVSGITMLCDLLRERGSFIIGGFRMNGELLSSIIIIIVNAMITDTHGATEVYTLVRAPRINNYNPPRCTLYNIL